MTLPAKNDISEKFLLKHLEKTGECVDFQLILCPYSIGVHPCLSPEDLLVEPGESKESEGHAPQHPVDEGQSDVVMMDPRLSEGETTSTLPKTHWKSSVCIYIYRYIHI